jgi:hypothetical protein
MKTRRFAERLMDHAGAVMPPERREWAEAMRAEFAALPQGREALAWAAGCVWASYCERIQPMNVFVKSLLRAAAVWLVVGGFIAVMILLHPLHVNDARLLRLVRLLSMFYGGMFVTLWICELLIARFWSEPGKIFKKTLLRTAALWLWPLGLSIVMLTRALTDKVFRARIDGEFWSWMQHWAVNWVTHYPVIFVAIFVPLLICEWAITRRTKRAA